MHVHSQDKLGLHCCPSIRISSTSFGRDHQPASMGNYNSIQGKINNRLVFKHLTGNYNLRNFWGFNKLRGIPQITFIIS